MTLVALPGTGQADRRSDADAAEQAARLRGAQKFGARTVTSALHGLVRDDPRTRQEFLALTTRIDHAH